MANSKVLANVMGMPVTDADVDEFIQRLGQRGQAYQNPQGRAVILEELINQKLLLIDAQRTFIEAEPEFKAQLAKMKDDLLVSFAVSKAIEKAKATDEEAKAFYDANPDQFQQEESVNASHILVDTEEEASKILADIKSGAVSFEDAAKKSSKCPSSQNGGNLGDFTKGQMVPEFDEACFNMNEGELKGPVKTQFGFHIIRLNKKNAASTAAFADVKEHILEHLLADKQKQAYQSKINQLKILYQVDKF